MTRTDIRRLAAASPTFYNCRARGTVRCSVRGDHRPRGEMMAEPASVIMATTTRRVRHVCVCRVENPMRGRGVGSGLTRVALLCPILDITIFASHVSPWRCSARGHPSPSHRLPVKLRGGLQLGCGGLPRQFRGSASSLKPMTRDGGNAIRLPLRRRAAASRMRVISRARS
jgi:hypothetical protein